MKIHLKFNHDADDMLSSLDCPFTENEVSVQFNNVMNKFMDGDQYKSKSHLSEIMHEDLDYSVILYMATKFITQELEQVAMKKALKRFLEDDEII